MLLEFLKVGEQSALNQRIKDTKSQAINAEEKNTHLATSSTSKYILSADNVPDVQVNEQRRDG
jgi:hypothetical protein